MTMNYPQRSKRSATNPKGTTPLRDVNAAVRVQQALKLKLEGATWEQVAAQSGYDSKGTAHHAVMRELDRCITLDGTELRKQQLYMLQTVQAKCYKSAMTEGNKNWMWDADRVVHYSERIAKLMGLDVPVDSTVNTNFTVVREIPQGWLAPVEVEA